MKRQAALFDLDGTLLDTLDDLADSMNQILRENGMPDHPVDPYRHYVGDGMLNLARRAAPAGTPDAVVQAMEARMNDVYAEKWKQKTRVYAGIPGLLGAMTRSGLKMGVLSNKPDPFTRLMIKHFFGDRSFDLVYGARPGVPKKPDPAAALEIAGEFRIDPENFLYLGDTDTDMRTGLAAGMFTIGVAWGFRPVGELREAGAMAIIDRPDQALEFLA